MTVSAKALTFCRSDFYTCERYALQIRKDEHPIGRRFFTHLEEAKLEKEALERISQYKYTIVKVLLTVTEREQNDK